MAHGHYQSSNYDHIQLPETIRCNGCGILKSPSSFASTRLTTLKRKIAESPHNALPTARVIACSSCTGQQKHEFKCHNCKVIKPRNRFARRQVTGENADTPTCNKCMDERKKEDADVGCDSDNSGSSSAGRSASSDEDSGHGGTTVGGTTVLNSGMASMSVSGTASSYGAGSRRGGSTVPGSSNSTSRAGGVQLSSTRGNSKYSESGFAPTSDCDTDAGSKFAKPPKRAQRTEQYSDIVNREIREEAEKNARRNGVDGPGGFSVQDDDDDE